LNRWYAWNWFISKHQPNQRAPPKIRPEGKFRLDLPSVKHWRRAPERALGHSNVDQTCVGGFSPFEVYFIEDAQLNFGDASRSKLRGIGM